MSFGLPNPPPGRQSGIKYRYLNAALLQAKSAIDDRTPPRAATAAVSLRADHRDWLSR
jgi:hypothetical protein